MSRSPFSKFPPCPFWGKVGIGVFLLLLTACSPKLTPVPVVEHHTDTCYIHDVLLDSVFVHESERTQHDTVYLTRIKEHYRYLHDTIRTSHTDTIPIIRTQEVVREVPKPVPRFYRASAWFMILFLLYWLFRIAKAVYLRR